MQLITGGELGADVIHSKAIHGAAQHRGAGRGCPAVEKDPLRLSDAWVFREDGVSLADLRLQRCSQGGSRSPQCTSTATLAGVRPLLIQKREPGVCRNATSSAHDTLPSTAGNPWRERWLQRQLGDALGAA
jgi:hypothetical protein